MDVLKRSEFCGVVTRLHNIKSGTVFSGFVDTYETSYIWMRTNVGIVRVGNKGGMGAGYCPPNIDSDCIVKDYEVLNATLVIDD